MIQAKYHETDDVASDDSESTNSKIMSSTRNFVRDSKNLTKEFVKQHRGWLRKIKQKMNISHKKYRLPILILILIAMIPLVVNILRLSSLFTQVFIFKKYQSKSLKLVYYNQTSKIVVDQRGLHKSENWGLIG